MEVDLFKTNDSKPHGDDLVRIHADVRVRVDALQHELSDIRKLERLLAQLVEYRDRSWLLHLKFACERESNLLKELRTQDHPAIPVVEALFRDAQSKASGVIQSIPAELERLSKARGITLDFARSRHPKYLFAEDGFIEVIVNDKKQSAYIATREGKLANLPADPEAIIDTVVTEDNVSSDGGSTANGSSATFAPPIWWHSRNRNLRMASRFRSVRFSAVCRVGLRPTRTTN